MPTGEWFSTQEAAEHLGITPRTLYRLIDRGELPGYRIGRVIRLRVKDIDGYIETCRIKPGELEHLYPSVELDADIAAAASVEGEEADTLSGAL